MADLETEVLSVEPIISYPREAEIGKSYLLSIDFRPLLTSEEKWPLESEECTIYCLLSAESLFSYRALGEPAVVIHRFGGSYGPARFLLTASDDEQEGKIHITLVNSWGVPLGEITRDINIIKQGVTTFPNSILTNRIQEAWSTSAESSISSSDSQVIEIEAEDDQENTGNQYDDIPHHSYAESIGVLKLFIIGLPGSGKSTIARYISLYLRDRGLGSIHISDHEILREMYLSDIEQKQFRPAAYDGFDVLDFSALDIALKKMEQMIRRLIVSAERYEIVLIEFERNDYSHAFRQFSSQFLQDAYFLYILTDVEICKKRIHERIVNPSTVDDFYVSDYIFEAYYRGGDGLDLPKILQADFGIDQKRVMILNNNYSLKDIEHSIESFIDFLK